MSVTSVNTDNNKNSINNVSNVSNVSSASASSPSMQDLMIMLQDQSRVISGLQRTIDDLNTTIKSLNGKIERMEAEANRNISINVTASSKFSEFDHLKTVYKNAESSKCQLSVESVEDADEIKMFILTLQFQKKEEIFLKFGQK